MQRKGIASLVVMLVIGCLIMGYIYKVLEFKTANGTLNIKYFYEQENDTVDLLVLGSSHAYMNISPAVLYDEYGITSYILGGTNQAFWNSYYYLTEALKTQHPELIVLEGYAANETSNYRPHGQILNNTLGIKDRCIRTEAMVASSPPNKVDDYLFNYRLWHSRYEDIDESGFRDYYVSPYFAYFKGYELHFECAAFEKPNVDDFQGAIKINQKEEIYFRKIIELCQQREIPIMVIIAPWVLPESAQQRNNYLTTIAEEYHVPCINYNSGEAYESIGLDFGSDMVDFGHLNYRGSRKFTSFLGKDIQSYVKLTDHRGDERYSSWQNCSEDINARISDFEVDFAGSWEDLVDAYDRDIHTVYLYTISDTKKIYEKTKLFNRLGVDGEYLQDGKLYLLDKQSFRQINNEGVEWKYETLLDGTYFLVENDLSVNDSQIISQNLMVFDEKQYIDDAQGVYLFVYDKFGAWAGIKQIRINAEGNVEVVKISKY